jgi:hypothetical protein
MGRPRFVASGAGWSETFGLISRILLWEIDFHVLAGAAGTDAFAALVDRFPIERVRDRKAA